MCDTRAEKFDDFLSTKYQCYIYYIPCAPGRGGTPPSRVPPPGRGGGGGPGGVWFQPTKLPPGQFWAKIDPPRGGSPGGSPGGVPGGDPPRGGGGPPRGGGGPPRGVPPRGGGVPPWPFSAPSPGEATPSRDGGSRKTGQTPKFSGGQKWPISVPTVAQCWSRGTPQPLPGGGGEGPLEKLPFETNLKLSTLYKITKVLMFDQPLLVELFSSPLLEGSAS